MSDGLRPIAALTLPSVEPGGADMARPTYRDVDPASLLVDERYQRNLSQHRSIALIKRIVAQWDWRAFKPPVVVEVDGGLHVIDGQHTAIAAASHPAIDSIPVQIVEGAEAANRAAAFVKHNRDRVAITAPQLHHALVAAGDEDALTIEQVCERAGARVLKFPPADGVFRPGDIMGIATLRKLVERRFAIGARRVLDICVGAKLAPISATAIRAIEYLLFEKEYEGEVDPEDLTTALRRLGDDADRQAKLFAAEHRVRAWRGLAVVLYRESRKKRHGPRVEA
jgi:hypothetical protein